MEKVDLKNGYEAWEQSYSQHKIGRIEISGMHHAHNGSSSISVRIHKYNDETPESYGDLIFNGTLEKLIRQLALFDCSFSNILKYLEENNANNQDS